MSILPALYKFFFHKQPPRYLVQNSFFYLGLESVQKNTQRFDNPIYTFYICKSFLVSIDWL